MSYRVKMTATAVKERKRLDTAPRQRVDKVLLSLSATPRPTGAKKLTGSRRDWRVRVGDYRILYEIDDAKEVVLVWRIAHRRQAYRGS